MFRKLECRYSENLAEKFIVLLHTLFKDYSSVCSVQHLFLVDRLLTVTGNDITQELCNYLLQIFVNS